MQKALGAGPSFLVDSCDTITLRQPLHGTHDLHCPSAAPTVGVISCTYHHWNRPFSKRRGYCQLPVLFEISCADLQA